MSDCKACSSQPSGAVNADCQQCRIREIARGPAFFTSMNGGVMTDDYKAQLAREFAADWRDGHRLVKEEAERIFAARRVVA